MTASVDWQEVCWERPEGLAARVIGGEAVVVTPLDSRVHELNATATFVWERCDGSRSGRALVASMVQVFEVSEAQAQSDVSELLRSLWSLGLVRPVETTR